MNKIDKRSDKRFGATILDAEGTRLTIAEKTFFREADPFGFILFARNIETPDQVRALCDDMRNAVGRDAPITIDQEGGRVQRLRAPQWREWATPLEFVTRNGRHAERAMYLRYRIIADELRGIGIDSNCAPMVDIAEDSTHGFLKNRCYGFSAETVARLGRSAAQGLLDGGVLPIVKHIPGHGRAVVDSHLGLPRVSASLDHLTTHDFAPFRALNDLPMGMTAHLVYCDVDELPATLSPKVMRLVRDDIGFDGLIMTDDISMKALSGSLADLSAASRAAGCDVVLFCNGTLAEKREVAEAAGMMDDAGQRRAQAALAARISPVPVDIAALERELGALQNGRM
ncbi:MAG: glycoside hydrolase family 3 N-terminal domain-containing protein [Rhodobacterales bacterium]|nr:glycoside hydrolase family 3 N-terminal domain-containing protein [Rhodobacterales bacterium]